jgi:uncharacterized membrane protein
MENKKVGWIIIGIGILMAVLVLIFNMGLKQIIEETCTHGSECTMYDSVAIQTWVSLAIVLVVLSIGIGIRFTKPKEKVIVKTKKIFEKRKKIDKSKLDKSEKEVVELLEKESGGMFQADLKERLGIGKVKITRLLDKLEAKQIVERKRRGMNNIVILKN